MATSIQNEALCKYKTVESFDDIPNYKNTKGLKLSRSSNVEQ
jgi:hypothetical protein